MNRASASSKVTRHRVFLVDDHPIVRQGLTLLINQEPDLAVCGEAQDARSVADALVGTRADILVLDLSLKGLDGFDLLKALREGEQRIPILVLSMHDEMVYAERVLRAGANGYIMKQEATERVLVAIRRILGGGVYVSDRIGNRMLQQLVTTRPVQREASIGSLTDRELEVFRLIGGGRGTREISQELRLSMKTVESYQAHIKEKLALRSARALIQRAIEWRLSEHEARAT